MPELARCSRRFIPAGCNNALAWLLRRLSPHALLHARRTKASGPAVLAAVCLSLAASLASAQAPGPAKVEIDWNKTILVSKSTPTLQVVTNPMLNPGAPIHDGSFAALKALGADYVRYVPWLPYPKIAVVELDAPTKEKTSWDFTYADPVTKDFLAATEGHRHPS